MPSARWWNGQFTMAELLLGWPLERSAPKIGFRPTPMPQHDASRPLRDAADSHPLVIAPTGAGKGCSVIIPNLLHNGGPAIVVDVKGEVASVTARHRREIGQEVVVLDSFGVLSTQSGSPNPLDLLTVSPSAIADDAFMLAEMIACGSRGTKEPFWDDHTANLIAGLIAHIAMAEEPPTEISAQCGTSQCKTICPCSSHVSWTPKARKISLTPPRLGLRATRLAATEAAIEMYERRV
jgi:hypothetical protein